MRPRFVYFDLDDTLLDHIGAEKAALEDVWNQFDWIQNVDRDTFKNTYHNINQQLWKKYGEGDIDRDYLQRHRFEDTLDELDLDAEAWEEVANYYIGQYSEHWAWIDGAMDAYNRVRNTFDVGIITNGFAELQRQKFDRFVFWQTASNLVVSEEIGIMKPQPGIFEYATRITGLDPERILYVGDSLHSDIEGGSSYGWKTAWYRSENHQQNGKSGADLEFSNFDTLCDTLGV